MKTKGAQRHLLFFFCSIVGLVFGYPALRLGENLCSSFSDINTLLLEVPVCVDIFIVG